MELSINPVCMATGYPVLNLPGMAQAQQADPGIQEYHTAITQLVLVDISILGTNMLMLCKTFTGASQPIVPLSW